MLDKIKDLLTMKHDDNWSIDLSTHRNCGIEEASGGYPAP